MNIIEPQAPSFKLEIFEGPLDLLLSLIDKNKVDIFDIPISLIFDQYMEHLDAMRALDMEVAGDFIVYAAELMLIKSHTLLPKPLDDEQEDPRAALAAALVEYRRAKIAAERLSDLYAQHAGRFTRAPEVLPPVSSPPAGLDAVLLCNAFSAILNKKRELPRLALRSERTLENLLSGRAVKVSERIIWIMRRLYVKPETNFESLLYTCNSRSELVATFIALLELLRGQRVTMKILGCEILLTLNRARRKDLSLTDEQAFEHELKESVNDAALPDSKTKEL